LSLDFARQAVAEQMEGRFQTFADNFVRGMRRLPEGLEVYRHLLEAVTDASDEELIEGLDSAMLLSRVNSYGNGGIRASDLTQALDRIDLLQVKINVTPPVPTYNRSSRKLTLAQGLPLLPPPRVPRWPWMTEEPEIVNDLAGAEPLTFGFDA
jgi:hypothetical protein